MTDLEALHNELRRTHILVRTGGEWIAYRSSGLAVSAVGCGAAHKGR